MEGDRTWIRSVGRAVMRRQETDWRFALLVGALFGAAQIVGHANHEMWRDELHCWGVGRNAAGLLDLLTGERRYDGHPFLWYYLLHLVSRLVRSYVALQVVGATLAITGALLWLRYAGLPRILRVLLLGSYYVLYEYGVMCRGYTLGVVLTFAFCALYHPVRIRFIPLGALLAMLSATSLYGTLMALALGLFLFSHGPFLEPPDALDGRRRLALPFDWIAGFGVFVAGVALTTVTTWPPSDAFWAPSTLAPVTADLVPRLLVNYWSAMFPFHTLTEWEWPHTDFLGSALGGTPWLLPLLGGLWMTAWLVALRRVPRLALCYFAGALAMAAANHFVLAAGPRHAGHYFILLVACLWLHARETRGRADDRLLCLLFAANLAVQVVTGVAALRADLRRTFSGATEAAAFIRAHHLQALPVVADGDHPLTPVAVILDRTFFFPSTGETAQTTVFHSRRAGADGNQIVQQAGRLAHESDGRALVLVNYDLGAPQAPGLTLTLLHRGGPAIMEDESVFIYEVQEAREVGEVREGQLDGGGSPAPVR